MSSLPVIVDIEASGFGPDSYPIEVGAVLATGERFSRLIKPFDHWQHWSPEAEIVHGISRQQIMERGLPGPEVARQLNEFLDGLVTYSDGWVVDKPWLEKLYYYSDMQMSFRLCPLEAILPDEQIEFWDQAKASVIERLKIPRHRASTDALIIQQTYLTSRDIASSFCYGNAQRQ